MAGFSLKNKVTVHYTGSFDDGEVFDTTKGRTPLTYIEGNHEVVPGFEAAVMGMEPGEKKKVHLEPKEAYGERTPALVYHMPTINIPNYDDLRVGEMIYLMNGEGYQQLARVLKVEDDGDTYFDFNHPMAGCALNFELELLSREPYDPKADKDGKDDKGDHEGEENDKDDHKGDKGKSKAGKGGPEADKGDHKGDGHHA